MRKYYYPCVSQSNSEHFPIHVFSLPVAAALTRNEGMSIVTKKALSKSSQRQTWLVTQSHRRECAGLILLAVRTSLFSSLISPRGKLRLQGAKQTYSNLLASNDLSLDQI